MRRRVAIFGLLSLLTLLIAPGDRAEPHALPWKALHFEASKFFLTARMDVRLEAIAPLAASDLLSSPEGRVSALPAHSLWTVDLTSAVAGRRTRTLVWFDPQSQNAIQKQRQKLGSKPYDKLSRYTLDGVYTRRRAPLTDAEVDRPATAWSKVQTKFEAYPTAPGEPETPPTAQCGAVLEATQLLYLLPTLDVTHPPTDLCVSDDGMLSRLLLEDKGPSQIAVDLEEISADGRGRRRSENITARRIVIRSQTLNSQAEGQLDLLGLEGDLELFIDEVNNLPLEIRGRLSHIGTVRVELVGVELAE